MKFSPFLFYIFFIPIFACSQSFNPSAGIFFPGEFTKKNIGASGKTIGVELKNNYSNDGKAFGASISLDFNNRIPYLTSSQYWQYLPAINKRESTRALLGIGLQETFILSSLYPLTFYHLFGQLGLQYKPRQLPLLLYGTVHPTFAISNLGTVNFADRFGFGSFRLGVNYSFGKKMDKQEEPEGDIISETKKISKNNETKNERRRMDEQKAEEDEQENEIPWTVEVPAKTESSSFTIKEGGTLLDIDGNAYKTMLLGKKRWMAENLKVSRFNNGNPIVEVTVDDEWSMASKPAWSRYDNAVAYEKVVGKLYNGYVLTAAQKVCPSGWHIPSDEEWQELVAALGGERVAVPKLKSVNGWMGSLKNNNTSGLKGLPGGARKDDGIFNGAGKLLVWWTSTAVADKTRLYCRFINADKQEFLRSSVSLKSGFSIRCKED